VSDVEACAKCTSTEKVVAVTPDIDVAAVPLCELCRLLLVCDPEEFEREGKRGKRKRATSRTARTS
jgi:hypothetical protein